MGVGVAAFVGTAAKGQVAGAETTDVTASNLDLRMRAMLERFGPDVLLRHERARTGRRGVLNERTRALIGLATLAAVADTAERYQARVRAALRAGVTPGETVEVAMHALVYAGFPAAQAATQQTQAVFAADNVSYRAATGRPTGDDRALGLANLRQTGGDAAALALGADDSDFADLAIGFAHGEILNRPGLPIRDRQIITLPMLLVSGHLHDALSYHAAACRRLGWSREEVVESLVQAAGDVGWARLVAAAEPLLEGLDRPVAAVGATAQLRTQDRGRALSDQARQRRGQEALDRISASSGQAVVSSFDGIAPDLGRYIVEFAYGDVFARPGLDLKSRELATVAALTATGRAGDLTPLTVHINAALNVGSSAREVTEAILHMLPYAGFPRVQKAIAAADAVFTERKLSVAPPKPERASPPLTIIGRLRAKPGRGGELKAALRPVVAASRQEPGCINYDLHVDAGDPDLLVLYENWTDQNALDEHFKKPHSVRLAARLPDLLATPLVMERLTEVSDWIGRKST